MGSNIIYAQVCRFREDFSNAFATKSQSGRPRREAFGVRRIPALSLRAVRNAHTAPEYGALQTLRALRNIFDSQPAQGHPRTTMKNISFLSIALCLMFTGKLALAAESEPGLRGE